jgi:hypothetical protein
MNAASTAAPATASADAGRGSSGLDKAFRAVLWLCIALLLLQILTFGYGRDQGIYAVVARTILDGGMPYRDAWDFKPPGIFLIYALSRALFGSGQWAIRLLEVLGLGAMVLGMVHLARRWWGQPSAGLLAGGLAVLVHTQLDFWHTAQPESFGGMLIIAGLCIGTSRAASRRPRLMHGLAGVLFGCAGLLKPPLAGAGAVFALWAMAEKAPTPDEVGPDRPLVQRARGLVRRGAEPVLSVLAGGALPFAVCLGWFWARGAFRPMWDALFVFTPHYTAIGYEGSSVPGLLYYSIEEWLVTYSALLLLGNALLLLGGPVLWRVRGVGLLVGIVGIQLLGVAMQAKYFPYHYGAVWPPTALLAARGWWWLWEGAKRRGWLAVVGFVGLLAVVGRARNATKDVAESFWTRFAMRLDIFRHAERDLARVDGLASVADVNAGENRAVANLLRDRVPRGQPVYIWGFEPVIYDLADLPCASCYIYNVPQRVSWAAEPSRAALMGDLAAHPPAAIVVVHNDVFPMVTGDNSDSAALLDGFGALRVLIEQRYQHAARIGDLDVYFPQPERAE